MKNKTYNLQSPFREAGLITASSFVSYCKDNGLYTSKEELEQFHKEGLLYPAIKVYRGICKSKNIYAKFGNDFEWGFVNPDDVKKFKPQKIDPKNYYSSGSFSIRTGWLEYYKENKMVEYPASQKFKTWNKKQYPLFITNYKLIEKDYEFFYDKTQLLSLKVINHERTFWNNFQRKEKDGLIESTKKYLDEINRFAELYIAIEDLIDRAFKKRNKIISEMRKNIIDDKSLTVEWKEEFDISFAPSLKTAAEGVLNEHSSTLGDIDRWTRFLAWQSIFQESNRSSKCIRTYLKSISEKDIIGAEDTNYMIYILNSFVFFLTGKQKMVKQIISYSQFPICTVCGHSFLPKRITQKTCADKKCIQENKNRSKRKKK